jgi:hypothetical protein
MMGDITSTSGSDGNPGPTPQQPRPRRRRRWWRVVAGLGLLAVIALGAMVAALPWALGTGPGRQFLLTNINRTLAPGAMNVDRFQFSWTGPTALTGFQLLDHQKQVVMAAPEMRWDRSLWQVLFESPRLGTMRFPSGALDLDISNGADGAVLCDVLELLKPVLQPSNPYTDLTIEITDGKLKLRAADLGLAEPIEASPVNIRFRRPSAPNAQVWTIALRGTDPWLSRPRSLDIRAEFNRWIARDDQTGDLKLTLTSENWPLAIQAMGTKLGFQLGGSLEASQLAGRWATSGATTLSNLHAAGPDLPGGPRVLEQPVQTTWDIGQTADGWDVRALDLRGPLGVVRATAGTINADGAATRIAGDIDLAAALGLLPAAKTEIAGHRLRKGRLMLTADLTLDGRAAETQVKENVGRRESVSRAPTLPDLNRPVRVGVEARVEGIEATRGDAPETILLADTTVAGQAIVDHAQGRVELSSLSATSPLGSIRAAGSLSEMTGRQMIDMAGTIDVDWSRIEEEMAARTDPNATIEGEPFAFRVTGPVAGPVTELVNRLDGEVQASVIAADVFGMKLGRVPIRVRSRRGELAIDPIETTLNEGRLRIVPELVGDPMSGAMSVRLDHRTTLETASVNDEVSRRVLSFVVPTLADATRVHGVVSLAIDRAEVPLLGDGATMAEGQMVFRDVEFLPGPLANELLAVVGGSANGNRPALRLDQPVVLSISDGAVRQRGLSIPLGNVASIDMEGSVTFDKKLDLRVSVPLAPEGLNGNAPPIVAAIVGGVRPVVPISGTLDDPKVDMKELGRGMGRMGLDIAGRAGLSGLDALIQRMSAPPDPEVQARRKAEAEQRAAEAARKKSERKAREAQKKQQRQARRGR